MKVTFEIRRIKNFTTTPEQCQVELIIHGGHQPRALDAMVFNNESDAVKTIGEIIQCIEQGDYQVIGQAEKV